MGRETSKSAFPAACIAKPRDVKAWSREDAEGECCTAETFCLDLTATPGTPWNKSAINVFVDDFIEVGAYACTDRALIQSMANRHFRTIKRHYERWVADKTAATQGMTVDRTPQKRERSKAQRKYNTHQRRLRIALWYPETRRHGPLLRQLGPDGMSSDEGEFVGGVLHHYRISSKPWRSARITGLMRLLDALYRRYRSEEGQGSLQGARPHLRYLSEDVSSTRPVPQLSRDAYDPTWLLGLRPLVRQDLRVQDSPYDFSVPEHIQM
ncbi:hypothetical protein FKP32DRAFT_1572235 [Trametes sanguinea]|nr:hypothetical protein FKP32DRAFT_1572235 [Trametes sanguinea]